MYAITLTNVVTNYKFNLDSIIDVLENEHMGFIMGYFEGVFHRNELHVDNVAGNEDHAWLYAHSDDGELEYKLDVKKVEK